MELCTGFSGHCRAGSWIRDREFPGWVKPFCRHQGNRVAALSLQVEQDGQEGHPKPGALAISLCTMGTICFSKKGLVSKPGAPTKPTRGFVIMR